MGVEEKWRWDGTGAPKGRLGEERGSHAWRCPLMVRESAGTGKHVWGIGGSEGNRAIISPCPLGTQEAYWGPGPKPLPTEAPSGHAEPESHPRDFPRTFSGHTGPAPRPCPHLSPAATHSPPQPKAFSDLCFLLLGFCFALLFHLYFYFF